MRDNNTSPRYATHDIPSRRSSPPFSAYAELPCSKTDVKEEQVISREGGTAASRQQQPPPDPAGIPPSKRAFEEDAEDEDGARLRRKHLLSVATSEPIRAALRDDRLVETVTRIDAAVRAEQALDTACEDPEFREFTEKILNTLEDNTGARRK